MNIYEIDSKIMELFDPETGEILNEELFEKFNIERTQKIENLILWYKNLVAESNAIKKEAENLISRQLSVSKKAERIKGYIEFILNGEEFKTSKCKVYWRKSKSINIVEKDKLIDWVKKTEEKDIIRYEEKISKKEIKRLIDSGEEIPGVELLERKNIQVK